jgi:hypothetical protein
VESIAARSGHHVVTTRPDSGSRRLTANSIGRFNMRRDMDLVRELLLSKHFQCEWAALRMR